jgi:hypothetical protein
MYNDNKFKIDVEMLNNEAYKYSEAEKIKKYNI